MEKTTLLFKNSTKKLIILIIIAFVFSLQSGVQGQTQEKVLFESNFSDLQTKWEIWDDPTEKKKSSQWRLGLVELSGIKNSNEKIATALLAGEKSWQNYTVETSLYKVGSYGFLTGIIFGYQDQKHFYIVGYNFEEDRFELEARTPGGYEMLSICEMEFPKREEIPFRLDFAGSRIRFSANDRVIFDIEDGRYTSGKFGLGASGLRGARVLFGPITVKYLDPSTLPPIKEQNLLSQRRGAKVVSRPNQEEFKDLIDHRLWLTTKDKDYRYTLDLDLQKKQLPLEAVFAFPMEKEVEIGSIGLQLVRNSFPGKVEFLVSEQNLENTFHSLGTFDVKPEKESYQEFKIKPVKAKYLKIRILSSTSEKYVRIHEMFVYGYPKRSEITTVSKEESKPGGNGNLLFKEDFISGNLSKWQVWDDPEANTKSQWVIVLSEFSGIENDMKSPATTLVTGDKDLKNYSIQTNLYAVQGDGDLTGVVFGYRNGKNYYIAGYNFHKDRFELAARTPHGLEILAFAKMGYLHKKWFPLQVDFAENRILFRFDGRVIFDIEDGRYVDGRVGFGTSALDKGAILLDKIKVISLDPSTLPTEHLQDLLSSRRGAAVIYRVTPPKDDQFWELIDHYLDEKEKMGNDYDLDFRKATLPEEAVFCFPQGRFVEIHSIGFKLDGRYFPKEIKFWVSNQTPKSGFKPLTTITLEPKAESYQEFSVKPVKAKYLKIQVTQGHDPKYLYIDEMFVKGYFKELGTKQSGEETLGEVQLMEKEPNNSIPEAQLLPLDTYLGGEAAQKDVDYFKLFLKEPGNSLTLYLDNIGILRPDYTLLTEDGIEIKPSDVVSVGSTMKITYTLDPDDYYLKIVRPETYLTIVYDDSGSMGKSVPIVKRVLEGYLDNLGEGLNIKLMKYTAEVFSLSDFTHNPAQLKQAIEKEVKGGGGTNTFLGLMEAINSVRNKKGNRAVLAIFDEIDGETNKYLQQYIELWDSILDAGISFSTIGVQSGWDNKTNYFRNTRRQIFKEIAYASRGQFYHSPSDKQVEQSANTIFKQLTAPVEYRLKAEWKAKAKKPGFIQILFEKGAEKEATKNVELILDASNSMWGQISGKSKISIAKKVLAHIINGLPDEMNVGLRMYGHRYNLKDKRACQDTELVVPIGPVAKNQLIDTINKIQPRGKTPLVYSTLQAAKDFEKIKNGSIILITDGIESCNGDINSIAPALKELGIDLKVHIVGFDIKEAEARKQLESIASSTGGTYLDAKDSQELLSSLEQTLQIEYEIIDEKGEVIAKGFVEGEPVRVMEGSYTLRLLLEPEPIEESITVKPGVKSSFILTKENKKWVIEERD